MVQTFSCDTKSRYRTAQAEAPPRPSRSVHGMPVTVADILSAQGSYGRRCGTRTSPHERACPVGGLVGDRPPSHPGEGRRKGFSTRRLLVPPGRRSREAETLADGKESWRQRMAKPWTSFRLRSHRDLFPRPWGYSKGPGRINWGTFIRMWNGDGIPLQAFNAVSGEPPGSGFTTADRETPRTLRKRS
jgi:hypothetical protein